MDPETTLAEIEKGWMSSYAGWIRYHPVSSPKHSDNFGDAIHHTSALYWAAYKLNIFFNRESMVIDAGFFARMRDDGFWRGQTGTGKRDHANRDAMTFWAPLCTAVMGQGFTDKCLKYCRKKNRLEFVQPHHIVYFRRARNKKTFWPLRIAGDQFELIDSWFDNIKLKKKKKWFQKDRDANPKSRELAWYTNGVDSSILKTVMRNIIAIDFNPTKLTEKNAKYIATHLEPKEAFKRYFSFVHDPNGDSAPPIWKLWMPILDQYYGKYW